ncbi:MAG: LuxR C-terminal-related transcriptional regulator, partial [Phycisphaerae bacterium]
LRHKPDLIIVDCNQPTSQVVDAVQMIQRLQPDARIVVLSAAVDPVTVQAWSRCSLRGYVVKDGDADEARRAVDAVLAGSEYYSAGVRGAIQANIIKNGAATLSRREAELLPLIARGLKLRDAAREMSVSYKTAESYRTSLLRKLGVKDRVELARYAIRERIIEA